MKSASRHADQLRAVEPPRRAALEAPTCVLPAACSCLAEVHSSFNKPGGKPASSTAVRRSGGPGAGLVAPRPSHCARAAKFRSVPWHKTVFRVCPKRALLVRRQDVFRRDRPRFVARTASGPVTAAMFPPAAAEKGERGASAWTCALSTRRLARRLSPNGASRSRPNSRVTVLRRPAPGRPAGHSAPPGNPAQARTYFHGFVRQSVPVVPSASTGLTHMNPGPQRPAQERPPPTRGRSHNVHPAPLSVATGPTIATPRQPGRKRLNPTTR